MIGDCQRIAVTTITELELALEVSAPQIVGAEPCRKFGPLVDGGRRSALTRPCRCKTAWIVLFAGTRISPSNFLTRSSRSLRAPQWGFSPLRVTMRLSICVGSWLA